jgi:hypothetical protein
MLQACKGLGSWTFAFYHKTISYRGQLYRNSATSALMPLLDPQQQAEQ